VINKPFGIRPEIDPQEKFEYSLGIADLNDGQSEQHPLENSIYINSAKF